jgi:tetratricopeptide (TPR) repeat protein
MRMYREMGSYPEKVGLKLRRAIYFTDVSPDPAQAMKAYIQALQVANELGMSPLSNEVIGIKTELVRFLEKTGNPKNSLDVLEALKRDCLAWIETASNVEKAVISNDVAVKQALGLSDKQILAERTRLLAWACKAATRIASLQANAYISDPAALKKNLTWAVNTTMRERQRREREGVKTGEGEWLTLDDQGCQLEQLAHFYEEKNEYYFAGQLFLQALRLKPEKDCHAVVLMNNLAIALAQQLPPVQPGSPAPSRMELAESGRTWAMQALALARTIAPPERTEECDVGCAVATHNLGEFAEMMHDHVEARKRYEEAAALSRAIGFEDGRANANEGLRRLDSSR